MSLRDSYEKNRKWSDKFMPQVKAELGKIILTEGDLKEDTQQVTDLKVLQFKSSVDPTKLKIAVRVRNNDVAGNWPYQFTIRAKIPSGASTELHKILRDGWGDWLFYGFIVDNKTLYRWFLLDLNVLRETFFSDREKYKGLAAQVLNPDGTVFVAWDVRDFPKELVIESSHNINRREDKGPHTVEWWEIGTK